MERDTRALVMTVQAVDVELKLEILVQERDQVAA